MAKIKVTNPKQIINGGAKKYYFKVKGVGGIKGDKGDKGDTGSQGPQGPQGNAATIEVGSTTTLPTGYDATVTNTGTINNAILNFGIPRGIKGDTGAKGDKGDKGDKGEQGNTGPQGPAGQNATVYIGTTTTGAPGTQASVYNSGTDRNAVLNFTIPQGATGATGPQGPAGQDGQNFTPTIVETLPTTGDQSKLYLTPKNYTAGTATGNPITISLGEDAGQIDSFKLDGDTFQQTYTGKNLFNDATAINSYIQSNGSVTPNDVWRASQLIKVSPNTSYIWHGEVYGVNQVVWAGYDSGSAFVSGQYKQVNSAPSLVIITGENTEYIRVGYRSDGMRNMQLELGSTASDYEPFVGGVPSPNPDYPQPIQTVTGEQTVEIVGKNLFDKDNMDIRNGYLYSTTFSYRTTNADRTFIVPCEPNTTYTISRSVITSSFRAAYIDLEPSEIPADASSETSLTCAGYIANNSGTSITITTSATAKSLLVHYGNTNTDGVTRIGQSVATIMVEKSASATTYAPYSKQTLPISLGSIELCKLGTYQDYIYKDGDSWKVHKENAKATFNGTEAGWNATGDSQAAPYFINLAERALWNYCDGISTHFKNKKAYPHNNGEFAIRTEGVTISFNKGGLASMDEWLSWLGSNNVTAYYPLAVGLVTDTTITDQTLIAQLEAVRTASLQASNTITNTATGSNLAGDMELGYYEYDPTNRYDKWLWLDLNNNYEKLGS